MVVDTARIACQRLGLDLAVLNDEHELGIAGEEMPVWIGHRVDGDA